MSLVAKSDQTTGNQTYCSYVIQSNDVVFAFTAPYSKQIDQSMSKVPHPGFDVDQAHSFFDKHGLAVRAVGVVVEDAELSYNAALENGATGNLEPVTLTQVSTGGKAKLAEVNLCGDVVLRLVSKHGFTGPYLPNFEPVDTLPISYGIKTLDHVLCNVSSLKDAAENVGGFIGCSRLQESETTVEAENESGLRSLVSLSSNQMVLLSISKIHFENKSDSHKGRTVQQSESAGLQRLALVCDDIFSTVREMRMRSHVGGFEFMPIPDAHFYEKLVIGYGGILSDQQWKECKELGIVVEEDQRGLFLHVFTQSLGDRPTIFIEVMQRLTRHQ